jgi:molybdopterin/thiamine biosynthesis adenylyltransferase
MNGLMAGQAQADVGDEFFAYWPGYPVFVDMNPSAIKKGGTYFARYKQLSKPLLVVTQNPVATKRKLELFKTELAGRPMPTVVVKSTKVPGAVPDDWPPKTVRQFLNWLRFFDVSCAREIKNKLIAYAKNPDSHVVVLITTPGLFYGVLVKLKDVKKKLRSPRENVAPSAMRARLNSRPISLLSVYRIDDRYVTSRNQPNRRTLAGKKIALVGCGTIGGYLAEMLVKAGAGLEGGELWLLDDDDLSPANIGRHRLGYGALLNNKAEALAEEIARTSPNAKVRPYPVDARKFSSLHQADFLIDATGEEALSHWLNATLVGERFIPAIFTWVEGAGAAVRAFLRDTPGAACYRCLQANDRSAKFPVLRFPNEEIHAGQGCEALYVPFPGTTSIQAAALACELTMDWVNESVSARLRTRVIDNTLAEATEDINPPRDQTCPACSTTTLG